MVRWSEGRLRALRNVKHRDLAKAVPALKRGHRDKARRDMPQFDAKTLPAFVAWLRRRGVKVAEETASVSALKPTQRHFDAQKVKEMAENAVAGKFPGIRDPILTSADGYILDGHHRWAALRMLDPKNTIRVLRAALPMDVLVKTAREFPGVKFKNLHKTAAAFFAEAVKLARVFGAEYDHDRLHNPLLTRRDRLRHLAETVRAKAKEPATSWSRATLGGGVLGAGFGAAIGATGGGRGAAIGAGLGGAAGAGIGALAKVRDDQALLHARHLAKRPHLLKRELNDLAVEHARAENRRRELDRFEDAERHRELTRKLDRLERRRTGAD